jgi:hypothetical protein
MVRLNEYEVIDWFIGYRLSVSDYGRDSDAGIVDARGGLILISAVEGDKWKG